VLADVDDSQRVSSASWREIQGEFYPDAAKSAERLTEGEVVPAFAEALHSDDVTKHLNWFQTFCRQKFGMDDHLEFFWKCSFVRLEVEMPDDATALDPLDPHMNCSKDFIQQHIIEGDDLRCVPYGKDGLEAIQKKYEYESQVEKIDEAFDEYTVLDHSPLFEPITERLEELKKLLGGERLLSAAHFLRAQSRSWRRTARHRPSSGRSQDIMLATDQDKSDEWCEKLKACPWDKQKTPAADDLPCYCFRGKTLETSRLSNVCQNHHFGLVHLCQPRAITALFAVQRVEGRSKINHWKFETGGKDTKVKRKSYYLVNMHFQSRGAGWYSVSLQLDSGEFAGNKDLFEGTNATIVCALMSYLIARHFVIFILNLPWRIRAVWALRDDRLLQDLLQESSASCAREVVEYRLLLLVDPHRTRSTFMSFPGICLELAAGALFIFGVIMSSANGVRWIGGRRGQDQTSVEYIMNTCSGMVLVFELLYDLCLDATLWHGLAWVLVYFNVFFLFIKDVGGLKWIGATIMLAFENLLYFVIFYLALIFGFGMVMWIQLGSHFVQYSTLSRVNIELLLLTLGFPSHAFDDIYPFQDNKSFVASLYLGVFLLLAVTISLNFFTTIMLDAYTMAIDPEGPEKNLMEFHERKLDAFMGLMGISNGRDPVDNQHEIEMAPQRKTLRLTLSRDPHPLTRESGHRDPPEALS